MGHCLVHNCRWKVLEKYGGTIGTILVEPLACNWKWKDRGILGNYPAPGQLQTPCYGSMRGGGSNLASFDAGVLFQVSRVKSFRPFPAVFALFFQFLWPAV